jgi:small subunit ribosomal protein S18
MKDIQTNKVQAVKHALNLVNYRNPNVLLHYTSEAAMIIPSRITKTTPFFQRQLAREIKRARFLALMVYCDNHR